MYMHPLGLLLTIIFCGVIWQGSRHTAALGILATVLYLTQGQAINVGFNFTAIRIALLVGLLRVKFKKETELFELNKMDRLLIAGCICGVVFYTIRNASSAAFFYEVGVAYNILLSYFVFRCLLPELEDLKAILPRLIILILPFVFLMIFEAATGRDLFAMFGGVDENSWARGEHFRARASFRSPITAGGFGAALAPFFASRYLAGAEKGRMILGFIACVIIVAASHSSGPLMGFIGGLVCLAMWRFRHRMQTVRRVMLVSLITLHLVMKAPVWFLIARMGELVGGDAYYRAALIDAFVQRFKEWWLIGTNDTSDWMPTLINGGADITNVLVEKGIEGGLLEVVLFVLLVGKGFQMLGIGRALAEERSHEDEWLFWGMGAVLVAHLVNQTSVTYFDQMHVLWLMILAAISSSVSSYNNSELLPEENSEHALENQAGTGYALSAQ